VTSAGSSSSITATENGPEYSSQWQNDLENFGAGSCLYIDI
jgi:hypothetical protein